MKFDKFTIKAQEALAQANNTASENGNQEIEDMHLMDALLKQSRRHHSPHT
jgi:ATP-dependent Clp protease ATP-binding subunit ClpB